ncbi:MAG: hypothetical protein LBQ58_07560 [Synergistaceae bacterium]|nr:hypothetical protein [Synergistaceae bacterium]
MASGDFTTVAEFDVDDDLTLLLATSGGIPRLGIYNTNSEKKKFVPLSWVEDANRVLKIKVGRSVKEYQIQVLMEGISSLIQGGAQIISLNTLSWRGVQLLGDLIHMPKTARSEADLSLIADNKRETLWYAYTPKRGNWRIKPCFATSGAEKNILDSAMEEGKPWSTPALSIPNGSLPFTMRNMPVIKEINNANPARWTEFMLPIARGMLLGFSDWSLGSEHLFADTLWKYLPTQNYRSEETIQAISTAARQFMTKIIAYIRLWPVLKHVQSEWVSDAIKTCDERGLKKRERFEMVAPNLGDKRFKVTRLVDEKTVVAFGIVPQTRLPGEQDRLIVLTEEDWETCLDACSLGGEPDPQYTCNSILAGIETMNWYARIREFLEWQPDKED